MAEQRSTGHDTANTTAAAAQVNVPSYTELFDGSGRSLMVRTEDVDHWLHTGFVRTRVDVLERVKDLPALFDAAKRAAAQAVADITKDGQIDTSDTAAFAVLQQSVNVLTGAVGECTDAIARLYPVSQGETVRMIDKNGTVHHVDPNQAHLVRSGLRGASGEDHPDPFEHIKGGLTPEKRGKA